MLSPAKVPHLCKTEQNSMRLIQVVDSQCTSSRHDMHDLPRMITPYGQYIKVSLKWVNVRCLESGMLLC